MALIICPECGKQVSDKAEKCPQCGCPINLATVIKEKTDFRTSTNVNSHIIVKPKEGCFLQTLNAGCMIIAIILIIIILCGVKVCS
jgi:uncharacterized membrane protein YvbJ